MAQRDAALEAFDGLRVREVVAWSSDTTSTFLAKFQTTAASLEPDRRIKLVVAYAHGLELLKAALSDPQANKICALRWVHHEKAEVNSIIPLLTDNRPELALLQVSFQWHSAFDFVSSVLERPSNKIKALKILSSIEGDLPRFFAALGQSQVSSLSLFSNDSSDFYQYLAKDLLVRLEAMNQCGPSETMMMALAKCTRLVELRLTAYGFFQPTALTQLPKSITKLKLERCTFAGGVDWSFLTESNVRELDLHGVKGVDAEQLGSALAVYLRAKGLNELCFHDCAFTNETLVATGVELGRVKRLDLKAGNLNDDSVKQIAIVLQSPNNEMKELRLEYEGGTMSNIENLLVPALRHPNCNLTKLSFLAYLSEHQAALKAIEDTFHRRRTLFVLLQGQQVRRVYCPLRRLPVEMFRMVGEVLV